MNWLEVFGFVSGLICVYLNTKENIWSWPIAMISVAIYGIVFFNSKLYADMGLQVFFFIISGFGWYNWLNIKAEKSALRISYSNRFHLILYVFLTLSLFGILYFVLTTYTDADLAMWDAISTALSIVAQLLLTRKKIENWIFWFIANIFYIGIYLYKSLHLTAFLYLLLLVLSVYGYFEWRKSLMKISKINDAPIG